MLFVLSYSIFLRIDTNRTLVRKNFNNTSSNTTWYRDPKWNCYKTCTNGSDVRNATTLPENKECISDFPQKDQVLICHPDRELNTDTSRIAFAILLGFLGFFFFVKLVFVVKNWTQKRTLEPYITLGTTFVAIIFLIIAIVVDGKDIPLTPTGVFDWDSGFFLLVLSMLLITLYLIACLVLKLFCHNVFYDQIFVEYFKCPEELMQWFTLIAAIIAVVDGWTERGASNGTTALSIATLSAL